MKVFNRNYLEAGKETFHSKDHIGLLIDLEDALPDSGVESIINLAIFLLYENNIHGSVTFNTQAIFETIENSINCKVCEEDISLEKITDILATGTDKELSAMEETVSEIIDSALAAA